ncbi:MAG: 4a-hydroxytetrahydrobiopterin dehydratase [Terrimicrobiaceae bacterium]
MLCSESEIQDALAGLPQWKRDGSTLEATFQFPSFSEAMAFVNRVAALAEEANHHPDIDIRWNKVRLTLTTHSAGGLTTKDFELARQLLDVATARPKT